MQITINITPEELAKFLSEIKNNNWVLNVNDLPKFSHSVQPYCNSHNNRKD